MSTALQAFPEYFYLLTVQSTTCVLVYLMREKGFTLKQGIEYVRKKRSIINPNYGFQAELAKLEERLKKGQMGEP